MLAFLYQFSAHMDFSILIHPFHAVINGIFQNRLQNQLHRQAGKCFLGNLKIDRKLIFKTDFLDIHIILRVLYFLRKTDDVLPPGKADAKETGKFRHHEDRILFLSALNHPHHGFQRVIEEMGVNLGLQCIHFRTPLLLLLLHFFFRKPVNLGKRLHKTFPQMDNLRTAIGGNIVHRKTVLPHLFQILI